MTTKTSLLCTARLALSNNFLVSRSEFWENPDMGIYVFRNGQVEGPFDELVLQQALANGTMSSGEMCCREGSELWIPASEFFPKVSGLQRLLSRFPVLNNFKQFWISSSLLVRIFTVIVGLGACTVSGCALLVIAVRVTGAGQIKLDPQTEQIIAREANKLALDKMPESVQKDWHRMHELEGEIDGENEAFQSVTAEAREMQSQFKAVENNISDEQMLYYRTQVGNEVALIQKLVADKTISTEEYKLIRARLPKDVVKEFPELR